MRPRATFRGGPSRLRRMTDTAADPVTRRALLRPTLKVSETARMDARRARVLVHAGCGTREDHRIRWEAS